MDRIERELNRLAHPPANPNDLAQRPYTPNPNPADINRNFGRPYTTPQPPQDTE